MIVRPDSTRQHDDAEPRYPRAFRHIGGQRNIIPLFERSYHLLERPDTALAVKRRAVVAGASDGADAEPFGGDGVEFSVAMPRNQHLGAMHFLGFDERREEMLTVPEHKDRRRQRLDDFIHIGRIKTELIGPPNQPQEFGRQKTHSALKPTAAQHIANQFFQWSGFAS